MFVFDHPSFDNHEGVHALFDEQTGLRAIIAVHSSALGPACGGCRLWDYATMDAAIDDALRLSMGMSYKSAMAGLSLGGGKCVVIRPRGEFDREALFAALGRQIDKLGGHYIAAADVGVNPQDLSVIGSQTRYVAGRKEGEGASGDSSPVTALGVFLGLKAAVRHRLKSDDLAGLTIGVQGVGHVGMHLCRYLHEAGASLVVTDINDELTAKAKSDFGAKIVGLNDIYSQDIDVFAPCALGRSINPDTLPMIKASIVAGAANNQLSTPEMGKALARQNILYAPDYVINAGGIINIASEIDGGYDPTWVDGKLAELETTLGEIFKLAERKKNPTNLIADDMARTRIGR